jgi:hypothetical protein
MSSSEKLKRYRQLLLDLAEVGNTHAVRITTPRYRLMYWYFRRCVSLTTSTILLVEHDQIPAACALEKCIVDSLLRGLHTGYTASEAELQKDLEKARQGRGTGYSNMSKLAKKIDTKFRAQMLHTKVKRTSELLNELGHGGFLSLALEGTPVPPMVEHSVMARAVLSVLVFLSFVFMAEGIDINPLIQVQRKFSDTEIMAVTELP